MDEGAEAGFRNTPLMHVIRSKYKSQFTMEFDMPDKQFVSYLSKKIDKNFTTLNNQK